MSLFNRLLSLNANNIPLENFFTEIVAYLFTEHQYLLFDWLKKLHILEQENYIDAEISTQQQFDPLLHHSIASRPDIFIRLQTEENHHDLIFIESKIGSHEGENQLSRYADILHNFNGCRRKILIYITRDFEPKTKDEVLKNMPPSNVQFIQLRWHQFYRFLCSQQNLPFIQEIILFMKEKNMAHNNQFSSIDILTLSNLVSSFKLMNQILEAEVVEKFNQITGSSKTSLGHQKQALTEFNEHKRYLIVHKFLSKFRAYDWWCGLGFFLNTSNLSEYPTVGICLQVSDRCEYRQEIINVMKLICQESDNWKGSNLNTVQDWATIRREKSIQQFLAQEDHIIAIQSFFLELLNDVKQIQQKYPELPWRSE